jgi:hypothetical protein
MYIDELPIWGMVGEYMVAQDDVILHSTPFYSMTSSPHHTTLPFVINDERDVIEHWSRITSRIHLHS